MAAAAERPGTPPAAASSLDRLLRPFADVRGGEAGTALLLMVNVFLLFTAYYFIKPVREAFILQGGATEIFGWTVGKAEIKAYASGLMALLLVFVVRWYGRLASAVPRQKLIAFVTVFFISNLVVFFLLAQGAIGVWLAIAFFVWVGIFNNLVVAQFWAFANDVYSTDQGRRLFPIVGFGASSGAVGGSWLAGRLIVLGESPMLLAAGALLGACIALTLIVHRREASRQEAPAAAAAEEPVGRRGGFGRVLTARYQLFIALLILVANIVNSTGEFILGKKVSAAAVEAVASGASGGLEQGPWIGRFYSQYFLWVNALTAVLQLFVVSRLLKYAGVRAALFVLPLVALGGYAVLAFGAALGLVRTVKVLENSTDYSVQNTTRHALFLPTSREVKYKAKAAIDTFFVRIGDFAAALLVFAGTALAFTVEQFAAVNIVLVGAWIALAVGVARRHRALESAPAPPGDGR
jgi:AAA family ATP:ADP antiporter